MRIPFFNKDEKEEEKIVASIEEYAELPEDESTNKMKVMVETLDGIGSVDKIMKKVREGSIVIASMRKMKENDATELKHCISRMKTACANIEGDIAGAGEEWIIITPTDAGIHREAQ